MPDHCQLRRDDRQASTRLRVSSNRGMPQNSLPELGGASGKLGNSSYAHDGRHRIGLPDDAVQPAPVANAPETFPNKPM
jgi:hypothetical protein